MKDRFLFFENFRRMADCLPDDMQLKFYKSLMSYVFDDTEPDDPVIKSLITAIKPSLNKEEKRGGNHNPTGQNQHNKTEKKNNEVKVGQNNNGLGQSEVKVGQSGQSFLETETGNGNKKQEIIKLHSPQSKTFAERLREIVCRKKNIRVDGRKLAGWAKSFDLLQTADGVSAERISAMLEWYSENAGGDYVPVAESGASFREKFTKLESARQRAEADKRRVGNWMNEKKEHDWSWV